MTEDTSQVPDPDQATLTRVASLVLAAADLEYTSAEQDGIDSAHHCVALDIFLVACEFSNLLTAQTAPEDLTEDPSLATILDDPVALMLEAEHRTRDLSTGALGTPGVLTAQMRLVEAVRGTRSLLAQAD